MKHLTGPEIVAQANKLSETMNIQEAMDTFLPIQEKRVLTMKYMEKAPDDKIIAILSPRIKHRFPDNALSVSLNGAKRALALMTGWPLERVESELESLKP